MNLKEIAALAGVSPAAVSRYFNGGSLSREKEERIRKVIEETDFHPNHLARDLRKGRVSQIGVIVPKIHSISVSEVLAGINEVLSKEGYLTLLGCSDGQDAKEADYLARMQSYQLAGVIVMATSVTAEKEALYRGLDLPVVITGQYYPTLDCVYHDDYHAMETLAQKMLEAGRRRYAYIGVSEEDPAVGQARRKGVFETLQKQGIDPERIPTAIAQFSVESGYQCMRRLLEQGCRPDGVLCATATIAHGAMLALKEEGLRIPEDTSIAGIGNDDANRISMPKLTTVRLYQTECGREAARILYDRMTEQSADSRSPRQTLLGYSLEERESI